MAMIRCCDYFELYRNGSLHIGRDFAADAKLASRWIAATLETPTAPLPIRV
jgi:hypothetical protein